MYTLIERFIENLTIIDLKNMAISKEIDLSDDELKFSFDFIKKNWKNILNNHGIFEIDKYKDKFSPENFIKIKKLIKESLIKYAHYL